MKYVRSQTGWLIFIFMVPISIFLLLVHLFQWGNNPIPLMPFLLIEGLLIFLTLLFYKLTIRIEGSRIRIIYGIGLIRINLKIDLLNNVSIIRTPWWYGWGIRITPKGILYNIHGSKAVRLEYRREGKSKKVMIGTPDPEVLKSALEKHFDLRDFH